MYTRAVIPPKRPLTEAPHLRNVIAYVFRESNLSVSPLVEPHKWLEQNAKEKFAVVVLDVQSLSYFPNEQRKLMQRAKPL
jgi:hypothetical protein